MKWISGLSALAAAGLMTTAAACITPPDTDYAGMSLTELEDACAAAMQGARESGPRTEGMMEAGEDYTDIGDSDVEACIVLQKRRDAEGK